MADSGIKKTTIYKKDLGKVGNSNEYILRYRIVSEDKNRTSHWSPTYAIPAEVLPVQGVQGDVQVIGNTVTVVWGSLLGTSAYDIFVGFDGAPLTWRATSSANSHSFVKTGTSSVQVQIQVEGISQSLNNALKIYLSPTKSLV
jgi:hypothetical protein